MSVVDATSSTIFHFSSSINPASDGAVMPSGLVIGDVLLALVVWADGGGGPATITSTDGFTLLGTLTQNNTTITIWIKAYDPALGLEWTSTTNDWVANQIIGLHDVTGADTFLEVTPFLGSPFNPPHTFTFNGNTSAPGDDLIVLGGLDPNNSDPWTYTDGTSTAGAWTNVPGQPSGQGAQTIMQYLSDFIAGGSTGTMSTVGDGTPGFIQTDYAGWMISMIKTAGTAPKESLFFGSGTTS